ncbi:MAG: hypothetical protein ACLGHE_08785 [Gammaproteobacteria bacterium]
MSKRTLLIVAAIAVMLLMALLNPSAERHRERIAEGHAERSSLEKVLGVGQLAAFVSHYHSLGVVSYTTVNGSVASVGVMGMVFFVG